MKQYTMKDFIDGKFAVKVNQKNCKDFLELCAKHRLCWASGEKTDEFTPYFNGPGSEIAIMCDKRSNVIGLVLGGPDTMIKYGILVVDYIDFEKEVAPTYYQITIDCNGTTTIATMTINGRGIKTAIARRNPEDKFDWKKGAELAFERLWNSPRKAKKMHGVREVKRWAKPGEYIKTVNAWVGYEGYYRDGDIFQVTECCKIPNNGWLIVNGVNFAISPNEYVVLEGYRPYESAAKKPSKEE